VLTEDVAHPPRLQRTERTSFVLIDRQARKGKLPSDHAPLLLDVDLS
jgi:hypothetical protein